MGLKILGGCKGSITIFQCLIFTALLVFIGVMVDGARIAAAERKVQSALNTAARSSLAMYDSDIAGEYGLFAVNAVSSINDEETNLNGAFKKYFYANMNTAGSFSFIKYHINDDATSISGSGRLVASSPDLFREQVLKYMKYRAPITITGNIIEKIKSSGLYKRLEFSESEKGVRGTRSELKEDIQDLNSDLRSINGSMKEASKLSGKEYLKKLDSILQKLPDASKHVGEIDGAYEEYSNSRKAADNFIVEANKEEVLKDNDTKIQAQVTEFQKLDQEMEKSKKAIEDFKNSITRARDEIKSLEDENTSIENRIKELNHDIDVLNHKKQIAIFEKDYNEVSYIKKSIVRNRERINDLQKDLDANNKKIKEIRKTIDGLRLGEFLAEEAEDNYEERPDGFADFSKIDTLTREFQGYLDGKSILNSWLIPEGEFQEANEDEHEFMEAALKSNRNMQVLRTEGDEDNAEDTNDSIINYLKKLNDEVIRYFSEGTAASIEKLYIIEYIMDKFTYHSSLTERERYFKKGEVEYILWGNSSENENIASTLKSIGYLRLAINTIDYFATSEVPNPILRLVYSVGRGLLQSVEDTYQLYKGKDISICPSLKNKGSAFKVNYSDHLRLFLLIQSVKDENSQLKNIRQLMQVNIRQTQEREEFRLGEYYTRVIGKTSVKINLIFLPVLHLDKLNIKGFEGGSYIITKECYTGY